MSESTARFGDFLLLMEQRLSEPAANSSDVLDCLLQTEEAFGKSFDPAVDYEAYAAVCLCRSMRRVLEKRE